MKTESSFVMEIQIDGFLVVQWGLQKREIDVEWFV